MHSSQLKLCQGVRLLKSRLEINSCIGVRYRCHMYMSTQNGTLEVDSPLRSSYLLTVFLFLDGGESDGVDCMFPLILVLLKISYSRMRMLEGLPPVSDLCWTSGGRTGGRQ